MGDHRVAVRVVTRHVFPDEAAYEAWCQAHGDGVFDPHPVWVESPDGTLTVSRKEFGEVGPFLSREFSSAAPGALFTLGTADEGRHGVVPGEEKEEA